MTAIARTTAKRMARTLSVVFDFDDWSVAGDDDLRCARLLDRRTDKKEDDQDDQRYGRLHRGRQQAACRRDVYQHALQDAHGNRNSKRQGHASKAGNDRGGQRRDDEPGEVRRPEPDNGREQDAGERRQEATDHPRHCFHGCRPSSVGFGHGRPINDGAHGESKPVPRRRNDISKATTAAAMRTINSLASSVTDPRR